MHAKRGKVKLAFLIVSKNVNFCKRHQILSLRQNKALLRQNRALDIKLLKFHKNRNNQAYLRKRDFQRKLVCQIWDHYWIHGIETSLGVVSDSNSEFLLALHLKRGKAKLAFMTISLEKCDFLQTVQNFIVTSK